MYQNIELDHLFIFVVLMMDILTVYGYFSKALYLPFLISLLQCYCSVFLICLQGGGDSAYFHHEQKYSVNIKTFQARDFQQDVGLRTTYSLSVFLCTAQLSCSCKRGPSRGATTADRLLQGKKHPSRTSYGTTSMKYQNTRYKDSLQTIKTIDSLQTHTMVLCLHIWYPAYRDLFSVLLIPMGKKNNLCLQGTHMAV